MVQSADLRLVTEATLNARVNSGIISGAIQVPSSSGGSGPIRDIRARGADPTATVAVNDTALQNTINDLEAIGGGTVLIPALPAGQSWTFGNTPIYLKDNVNFSAFGAVIKKSSTASFYALFVSQGRGQTGYGSGVRNVLWQGGIFQGSFTAGAELYFCPFALHHADNMTVEHVEFRELQKNAGHVFDMGGCSNITIRDCKFYGFDGSDRSEAIQADASENGALSYQDSLEVSTNSFDGLFTKNVTVEYCQFLPITVGGVTFPSVGGAFGSHHLREGGHYSNMVYRNNINVDPAQDDTLFFSRGIVHFVTVRGLKVQNNRFIQTTGRVNRCVTVLSAKDSVVTAGHNANVSPAVRTNLAIPMISSDIDISGNTFIGFGPAEGTTIAEPTVYVVGMANGLIEKVTVDNNFEDGYTSATTPGTSAIRAEYVRGLTVPASCKITRYNTGAYIQNCEDVDYFGTITDAYCVGSLYPIYFNTNNIFSLKPKIIRPRRPLYCTSNNGEIGGTYYDGKGTGGDGAAINVANGANVNVKAQITRLDAAAASQAISIYGAATKINATGSIITGAFTTPVANSSSASATNVTTGNI